MADTAWALAWAPAAPVGTAALAVLVRRAAAWAWPKRSVVAAVWDLWDRVAAWDNRALAAWPTGTA